LARKVKILNLDLEKIDLDVLEKILYSVEKEIRNYLADKLPRRTEYDLVLGVEKSDNITLYIDLGVIGGYDDIINYDEIVRDAINVARNVFERELEKYRK